MINILCGITSPQIGIALQLAGNKSLQSSLQGNKYNSSDIETVPNANLLNIELTIYRIIYDQIIFFQECTWNTVNTVEYWTHFNDFL